MVLSELKQHLGTEADFCYPSPDKKWKWKASTAEMSFLCCISNQEANEEKELFTIHAKELERQIELLQIRKQYLEVKATYWDALERGDTRTAQFITEEIHRLAARLTE